MPKRYLLTDRDVEVLRWTGEQYGAPVDQVQQLLGREQRQIKGEKLGAHIRSTTKEAGTVTVVTAERKIKKWMEMGMVEREKLFMGKPAWIWLTRKGLSLLDNDYRYLRPRLATLAHIYAANQVRLHLEAQFEQQGRVYTWHSDRLLKKRYASEKEATDRDRKENEPPAQEKHIPDAEIEMEVDGKPATLAIEVELTRKTKQRLRAILAELAPAYGSIWYFAPPTVEPFVKAQIATLPEDQQKRFVVYPLPKD